MFDALLLIVQEISVHLTKASRSGEAATRRNKVPEAYIIEGLSKNLESGYFVQELKYHEKLKHFSFKGDSFCFLRGRKEVC